MSKSLIRAGQFAQVARQAALIGVALVLPRLGLGREVIGEWESLLYVGYVLGFGWLTGLLQAYLVRVRMTRPAEAARFSRLTMLAVGFFSLLLLSLAALLHGPLFSALRVGEAPPGWYWFFVYLAAQWPGLFFEQVLVVRQQPVALALFGGGSALSLGLAILLPLYLGLDLADALFYLALLAGLKGLVLMGWLVFMGWTKAEEASSKRPQQASGTLIREWLSTAWPLMTYATVGGLVVAFDPWFVQYWYDGDEAIFAIFRYGVRELPLVVALTNGAMAVVLPHLTESPSAGLDLLRSASRRLFHWVFGLTLLLMVTSPWWWTAVFTEVFAESLPLFRVYLLVVVSRLLFPVPVLTALGYTRLLALFGLLELVLNVVLSLLLVPAFGLVGIVWATVLAYLVDKVLLMAYLYYRTGIRPERYMDWKWFGGYVLMLIIAFLWGN